MGGAFGLFSRKHNESPSEAAAAAAASSAYTGIYYTEIGPKTEQDTESESSESNVPAADRNSATIKAVVSVVRQKTAL